MAQGNGGDLSEYRLKQAEEHIDKLEEQVEDLKSSITQMKLDAEARERKRLLWGIGALGTVITTLGAVIWQYRAVIFK